MTITLAQQPAAGDALVIAMAHQSINWNGPISSISGAGIASYTSIVNSAVSGFNENLWIGFNASGSGGTSLTVTFPSTGDAVILGIAEFSGLGTGTADGAAASSSGTVSTGTTPSKTTTNASDLVLGLIATGNATAMTGDGVFTQFGSTPANNAASLALGAAYGIKSATGTYSTSWTSTVVGWDAAIAAYQKAGGTVCGNPVSGAGSSARRDPALWPFATNSPWNYPIGSNATYSTAALGNGNTWAQISTSDWFKIEPSSVAPTILIGQTTDPLQVLCAFGSADATATNTAYGTYTFSRHFPASFSLGTGEWEIAAITPDHLTLTELFDPSLQSTGNCGAGYYGVSFGNLSPNVDLKGSGIWGTPGTGATDGSMAIALNTGDEATPFNVLGVASGSPISAIGPITAAQTPIIAGAIRKGELANGISHALALSVADGLLNVNAPSGKCYTWPAVACDSNTTAYSTHGPLYFGGLVAIPLTVNLAGHVFQTTQGKNIAYALQLYGAYIINTTCATCANAQVAIDFNAETEVPSDSPGTGFNTDSTWIMSQLAVVTNSYHPDGTAVQGGYKLDGGDGTLSAPLAPAFDR